MDDKQFEIFYQTSADGSMQPALLQKARSSAPRPLLVALHTWSCDRYTCSWEHYRSCCEKLDWHVIYPDFRGPNTRPEACGSDLVVKDIVSALEYAKSVCNVKPDQIYLAGGSGGGHAALLVAGRHPELWTAVSAWCPISDIKAWHKECENHCRVYHDHIELVCQGDPQTGEAAAAEAIKRSPATYLAAAKNKTIIDISTGIHDGHTGSVPISQSFRAFNLLCDPADRFTESEIDFMVKNEAIPEALQYQGEPEAAFQEKTVLLRRVSGNVRITIFEGGHNILGQAACAWLANQLEPLKPDWQLCTPVGDIQATELTH
jgi:pimeloyl-ACP methyl ester carboxylesterase